MILMMLKPTALTEGPPTTASVQTNGLCQRWPTYHVNVFIWQETYDVAKLAFLVDAASSAFCRSCFANAHFICILKLLILSCVLPHLAGIQTHSSFFV